jgi:hypothetical protein
MRKHLRFKAWILLLVFLTETFAPLQSFALTSGPSQPEMASFTPAGTTEMVDPFTGDFSYNIPLMDVEGYPINIAYNSDITMEQEASWVGLGWNLNVGSVNRSVRGLPDDFKGDEVVTENNLKEMKILKYGVGLGYEFLGEKDKVKFFGYNVSGQMTYEFNNYRGFGLSIGASLGPSLKLGPLVTSGNVGFDLNTLDGTSFNSSLGQRAAFYLSAGVTRSSSYNTRTGQSILSLGSTAGFAIPVNSERTKKNGKVITQEGGITHQFGISDTYIPISLNSYTPNSTIPMTSSSVAFSATVGGEILGGHGNARLFGSYSTQKIKTGSETITNKAYGYLHHELATEKDLVDFNRDKQNVLNKTIRYLSPANTTYDIFTVRGQGVAGTFRPFRNEVITVHDPAYTFSDRQSTSGGLEYGAGGLFHGGADFSTIEVTSSYTPWYGGAHSNYTAVEKKEGSLAENVYFKAAGELTEGDVAYYEEDLKADKAIDFELSGFNTNPIIRLSDGTTDVPFSTPPNTKRKPRSKLFTYLTAEEVLDEQGQIEQIHHYYGNFYSGTDFPADPNYLHRDPINRTDANKKPHHLSKIIQTNPNGERFVYGIPAYNLHKEEVSYRTNVEPDINTSLGLLNRVIHNSEPKYALGGLDEYLKKTTTPAYAHSFLLTEKRSADYRDVTGDGISLDDPGSAWKFNYLRKSHSYGWRVPYEGNSYDKGFETDEDDEMASYTYGTKELWYVHSIESKNMVAEFKLEEREDALGADKNYPHKGGKPSTVNPEDRSHLLKKIVLYNKYDRLENGPDAIPIKTVEFSYDYHLCPGVANQEDLGANDKGTGKLTLTSIEISYGKSEKGKLSPYQFHYAGDNGYPGVNHSYNPNNVDRWGYFKNVAINPLDVNNEAVQNHLFPYTAQEANNSVTESAWNQWASTWKLVEIQLPSGGKINVDYEADDYAFVQDQAAMQMFPVVNSGTSTVKEGLTNLYGKDYLYIETPEEIKNDLSITAAMLPRLFLGEKGSMENMYFRFLTDINDKTDAKEYVSGYVKALNIGFCDGARDYLWIQLEDGGSTNKISETAWAFFRENLYRVLYDHPNVKDGAISNLIKGAVANVRDIRQFVVGVEEYLESKKVADDFQAKESYIRLYMPTSKKRGGGSRVAKITMNDNWASMATTDGSNATYGKEYDYTTTDQNGRTISSGVAMYEPMVGGDENPFRQPSPYVVQGMNGHIPSINAYQELPLAESFMPGTTVGYSRVLEKNIHYNQGRKSKAMREYRYYTAKDFPVLIDRTDIQIHNNPSSKHRMLYPFENQTNRSQFAASQGYAILLNDMHGKPLSDRLFTLEEIAGREVEQTLSATRYNYHETNTPKGRKLNNKVQVLTEDGYVKEKLLGAEYDITIDGQRSYNKSKTRTDMANLDVLPGIGFIPFIPLPFKYHYGVSEIEDVKTVVLTKVIQTYGILESIETATDQYTQVAYNRLYDGLSGQVVLTERVDEHNRSEYEFRFPAYKNFENLRMGGAYENWGYTAAIELEKDPGCAASGVYKDQEGLKHGDEVLVEKNGTYYSAWVDREYDGIQQAEDLERLKDCYYNGYWDLGEGAIFHYVNTGGSSVSCNYTPLSSPVYAYSKSVGDQDFVAGAEVFFPKGGFNEFIEAPNQLKVTGGYSSLECTLLEEFGQDGNGSNTDFFGQFENNNNNIYTGSSYNSIGNGVMQTNDLFEMNLPLPLFHEMLNTQDFYTQSRVINLGSSGNASITQHYIGDVKVPNIPALDNYFDNATFSLWDLNLSTMLLVNLPSEDANGLQQDNYWVVQFEPSLNWTTLDLNGDPLVDGNNNRLCPGSFQLIDRNGTKLENLEGGSLKVLRSGNRNMLEYTEGVVVSEEYPLELDVNNKFMGLKSTATTNHLQLSAQDYSENYALQQGYGSNNYNKFLSASDGNFLPKTTYKHLSARFQNKYGLEAAKDGYLKDLPTLWYPELKEDACQEFFYSPMSKNASGWLLQEEIDLYSETGLSLEGHNNLSISSSVLLDNFGRVEVLAQNTVQSALAIESFENYHFLDVANGRRKNQHFSLLKKEASNDQLTQLPGMSYLRTQLSTTEEALLVKGEAHSGDYSLFLKGDRTGTGAFDLSYSVEPLATLIRKQIGEEVLSSTQVENFASDQAYTDLRDLSFNTYKNNAKTDLAIEMDAANGTNGQNTYTITIDPTQTNTSAADYSEWKPEEGKSYYLSVWVKDLLLSEKPFYGTTPGVVVSAGGVQAPAFEVESEAIDGWYQLKGSFTFPTGTTPTFTLTLDGGLFGAFFDDLRIHPVESNMLSHVYESLSGRLKARLDENNFATFFDYDEEGILVQTRRETPEGVLTITESRQSNFNHPNP